jgi:LmbE family N-acetylglucosaminyl deacetylase
VPRPEPSHSLLRLGGGPLRVLCLGAHADDIEIGCGGTILRLLAERTDVEVHWHVFSAPGHRRDEACRSARDWLSTVSRSQVGIGTFRESFFPAQWMAIKRHFENIRRICEPDVVFTHGRDDRHQDHRVLSDLTWNTFRDHLVLEYEIPKYDGDLGQPNTYVALDEATCRRKVVALMQHFASQAGRHWFTEDTFWALLRLRGIEAGPRVRFAEAFHARKVILC